MNWNLHDSIGWESSWIGKNWSSQCQFTRVGVNSSIKYLSESRSFAIGKICIVFLSWKSSARKLCGNIKKNQICYLNGFSIWCVNYHRFCLATVWTKSINIGFLHCPHYLRNSISWKKHWVLVFPEQFLYQFLIKKLSGTVACT